ncbi:MAG: YdcF family protein, partial [Clostridiales bacterium]|nr:YdcF family protein [Clostridiales bacterium]
NIYNSKQIILKNNLSTNVAIVSSDFHLKRASMIAQKNGLTPYRISAHSGFFDVPTFYVRDTLGVIKEFFTQ